MTKNVKRHVRHKITMALVNAYMGLIDGDEMRHVRHDAELICDAIAVEYDGKRGAGALWLDGKLKDGDWLYDVQSRVMGLC